MAIDVKDILYYGRFYPSINEDIPFWWYDNEKGEVIELTELLKTVGISAIDESKINEMRDMGFYPLFRLDIIQLEKKFVGITLSKKEAAPLDSLLDASEYDKTFKYIIERYNLDRRWAEFEYEALHNAAVIWINKNHLRIRVR